MHLIAVACGPTRALKKSRAVTILLHLLSALARQAIIGEDLHTHERARGDGARRQTARRIPFCAHTAGEQSNLRKLTTLQAFLVFAF